MIKKNNFLFLFFFYLILVTFVYLLLQINEFPYKYVFTEWLINYEGGYVRRGLLGQVVFLISIFFNLDLKFVILSFQILIYFIYFGVFYLIFSKIKINYFWILTIFSPILFLYPLVELMALGRKDIFVISFFLIFSILNYKNLNFLIFNFILFFGFSCFIHEITIFYLFHYLIVIYFYSRFILKEKIKKNHMVLLIIFVSFLLYLNLYLHNFVKVEEIIKSYNYENITVESGAFSHLKPLLGSVFFSTLSQIKFIHVIKYLFIFILNSMPFIYFIKFSTFKNLKYFTSGNFLFFLFLLSLPIYALVLDWGRVIYINYNFFLILLIFCFKLKLVNLNYLENKIRDLSNIFKIIFFIFICLLFSPDILAKNNLEYFPLLNQIFRFFGGIIEFVY